MKLQPDRVNELFMETIGMDDENENSELSKNTEEEIHVCYDRDAFIKESCYDELELGLTVSFREEQETAKERTDDDRIHSSEEEETNESQSQNTPDMTDITEDEDQEPNRENLTCMQNDVKVLKMKTRLSFIVSLMKKTQARKEVSLMMAIKTIKKITLVLLKMKATQQVKNLTGYFSLIPVSRTCILKNGRRKGELNINGMVRLEA